MRWTVHIQAWREGVYWTLRRLVKADGRDEAYRLVEAHLAADGFRRMFHVGCSEARGSSADEDHILRRGPKPCAAWENREPGEACMLCRPPEAYEGQLALFG